MKKKLKYEPGTVIKIDNHEIEGYGIVEELREYYEKPYVILILAFKKKLVDRELHRTIASENELSDAPKHILEQLYRDATVYLERKKMIADIVINKTNLHYHDSSTLKRVNQLQLF